MWGFILCLTNFFFKTNVGLHPTFVFCPDFSATIIACCVTHLYVLSAMQQSLSESSSSFSII